MPAYGPHITPDEVLELLLAVARHDDQRALREHAAELERVKGLAPRTINAGRPAPFVTVGRLTDEDDRQPQDWAPALMFYLAGTAGVPQLNEDRHLDFDWTVAAEVTYLGVSRTDAVRGSWWLASVVAQALLQRTPRNGIVQSLRLRAMEPAPPATGQTQRIAQVRLLFDASVGDQLAINGAGPLPLPNVPDAPLLFPPAPLDDPYDAPPSPTTTDRAIADVTKEPL